jgi:hypothetical protein
MYDNTNARTRWCRRWSPGRQRIMAAEAALGWSDDTPRGPDVDRDRQALAEAYELVVREDLV